MRRIGRVAIVWAAVFLMAVDPASACRFRRRCCPPPCCYTRCVPCCAPVVCCESSPAGGEPSPTPADDGSQQAPLPEPTPAPLPEPSLNQRPAPPVQPPADDMPEEPAPAPPADEMPEEPAPKSGNDVDDLFKDADDKTPTDKTEPAEEPTAPKQDQSDDAEDLFKDSDPKDKKAAAARSVEDAALAKLRAEIENLFDEPAVNTASNSMRLWSDNTGKFQIYARLISVNDTHVRLLKDTGKYTTVSFNRLSRADLAFVRQHATNVIAQK